MFGTGMWESCESAAVQKNNSSHIFHKTNVLWRQAMLLKLYKDGILSEGDTRELMGMMKKYNIDYDELFEKYHFPTERRRGTDYYFMTVPDPTASQGRRQIRSKTIKGLIQKVILFEGGHLGKVTKTFGQQFEFMQHQLVEGIRDKEKLASALSTVAVHCSEYDRYFAGTALEDMKVDKIRKADIVEVIMLNLQRYALRQSTFNDMRNLVCMVMRQCYQDEIIDENPTDRINWNDRRFKNKLIQPTPISRRIYTEEELLMIWDEAVNSAVQNRKCRPASMVTSLALRFQILTGLRAGEVCPLKWSDLGEADGIAYIEIRRQKNRVPKSRFNPKEYQIIKEYTKTQMSRRVPLTEALQELISEIRTYDSANFPDSPFLFPAEKSEDGALGTNSVPNFLRRICLRLGIPVSADAIRGSHAFRRNIAKDINNSEVSAKVLGNDVPVLEKNYYNGLDLRAARNAMENSPILKREEQKTA